MPKGPKGQKRPADLNKRAALIVRLATGEEEERESPKGHAGGKVGGRSRAAKLSPNKRAEIARKAAEARWGTKGNG